ncbi:MAG TPA: DegT/DnrJ/EryC1/StrS family aminotransferase [Chloroflexota bacterium]|nr:DegT/DnrJ/EryC1/StrS family aminotransferase [Chloroflexota bacterium]
MATLAINGGEAVRTAQFPSWPIWDQRELDQVTEVVKSGNWGGIPGTKCQEFATTFARLQNATYGVPVMNGTAALQVSLRAVGVGAGDEVIVPALTWIATPQAALYLGAIAVFCDVEPDTFNLDVARLEASITSRTKAIVPVHLGGLPVNLDAVLAVARKHHLAVIEDCAHAHGAQWRGRGVGSWGDLGAFSFQQSKVVTSGEGGCILTNDRHLAELSASLINCGRIRKDDETLVEHPFGYNFRLTDLQAAMLVAQLSRLDELTARRAANARILDSQLARIDGLAPLRREPGVDRQAYYIYHFRYDPDRFDGLSRDDFCKAMRAEGIPCGSVRGQLVYKNPLFGANPVRSAPAVIPGPNGLVDYSEVSCPVAEDVAERTGVALEQHILLGTADDVADVARAAQKVREHAHEAVGAAASPPASRGRR